MVLIWHWWGAMFLAGLLVGCVGAWATQATRIVLKTVTVPMILIVTRLAFPNVYPIKSSPLYIFLDLVVLAVGALIGDYFLGLKLGRHGRDGFRQDSVGH